MSKPAIYRQLHRRLTLPVRLCQNETMIMIRPAAPSDSEAIWSILEPVIRAGETYALPSDLSKEAGLAY